MNLRKCITLCLFMLSLALPVTAYADSYKVVTEVYDEGLAIDESSTRSEDHIEYYYRWYNGVLQYRRWNATRGYWIDATWLDMP